LVFKNSVRSFIIETYMTASRKRIVLVKRKTKVENSAIMNIYDHSLFQDTFMENSVNESGFIEIIDESDLGGREKHVMRIF
jgi:hypothetical protein